MRIFFYGYLYRAGCPFLWDRHRNIVDVRQARIPRQISYWIDGGFLPGTRWHENSRMELLREDLRQEDVVRAYYFEEWSVFGKYDRSLDTRPDSHATFIMNVKLHFDAAYPWIQRWYPDVTRRFPFPLRLSAD